MTSFEEDDENDISTLGAQKAAGELIVKTLTPAAEEVGKGLATVAKAVNISLAPLSAIVWGYDQICSYIEGAITKKLKDANSNDITSPAIYIAGPAIEAMRFSAEEENTKDLFAGLIATAMCSKTKANAHPAYVEIIKQLSSDEAIILKTIYLTGQYPEVVDENYEILDGNDEGEYHVLVKFRSYCQSMNLKNPNLLDLYFDNLQRLRLLEVKKNSMPIVEQRIDIFNETKLTIDKSAYAYVSVTSFGENFFVACIYE